MSVWRTLGWATVVTALPISLGVALAPTTVTVRPTGAEVDLDTVAIARDGFCDEVGTDPVTAALGTSAESAQTWSPGESARVADGVTDLVEEFGCRWRADAREVSGWVFAPAITVARARSLAVVPDGCTAVRADPGLADFGKPSVGYRCGDRVVAAGLFGDAWLSCAVTGPGAIGRLDQWCRDVAAAAAVG